MDSFNQRKKDILNKKDKSSIGGWDEKIKSLCQKINESKDYYTTSSCSGRIMILRDEDKKGPGLFYFVSHDKVSLKKLLENVPEKGDYKFKQEPMILHVACSDVDKAKQILDKCRKAGFKRAGIISLGKNIIIEVIGTEKIEFPLICEGKLLVNEEFLNIVLEKSNDNLEKNWNGLNKLEQVIS